MEFKKVKIQNFKGIADMDLEFAPGINLVLGENGVGKTSILEALTIALSDYFNGIEGVSKKGILSSHVRFDTHLVGDASTKREYYTPTLIESQIHLGSEIGLGAVRRNDQNGKSTTKYLGKAYAQYASCLCNDMASTLPLLCYFSTQRLAKPQKEVPSTNKKNKLNDRRCGYIGCMDDNLDRKALEAWCLKMETAAFKRNAQIHEYEVFKEIVSSFMKSMNELDEMPEVEYSRQFEEMAYVEKGNSTPIKYLSAGYQSLLWIVMVMAFRLCQLNPSVDNYKDVPGIVLIDEIDMHLHPRWQWKIVDALKTTFPRVQFILATHAPIIISSCKDARLIRIDDDQSVHDLPSAYATAIDDVAELTQSSSGVPIMLMNLRKKFEEAFRSDDKQRAETIYREMLAEFGESNAEVDLARRRLSIM